MRRKARHPDMTIERLLDELEAHGVDPQVIEKFVLRALERERERDADKKSPDTG